MLPAQTNRTTIGLATVLVTNNAIDNDIPALLLTYLLAQGPPNAVIDINGIITWTPIAAQVPSTNLFQTVVTDNGSPPLSATNSFTVFVQPVHNGPVLASIADRSIHAGAMLTISNAATDSDIPSHALTFSLDTGAPAGAAVNATNGLFTWETGDTVANTTNSMTVRVADDALPSLSDTKSFTVTVLSRPAIQSITLSNDIVTITWSALAGQTYRLQYQDTLTGTNWNVLPPDVIATGPAATQTDSIGSNAQRFYRIVLVP